MQDVQEESIPHVSVVQIVSNETSENEPLLESSPEQTSSNETESVNSQSFDDFPEIKMARTTDCVVKALEDDNEQIGESSQIVLRKLNHTRTQVFTIDDLPPSKWAKRFQEFQAWMSAKNLSEECQFEILSEL